VHFCKIIEFLGKKLKKTAQKPKLIDFFLLENDEE
jgi:hypothetical protein